MGLFEQFPYANFHELNLDWFLKTFKELLADWEEYKNQINQIVADMEAAWIEQQQKFDDINDAWEAMKQWILDYFENLDVQQEINVKLTQMANSGQLDPLISPFVPSAVADWLSDNITPTTPAVDASLSVPGAAADAKVTGDTFKHINDGLETSFKIGLALHPSVSVDSFINSTNNSIASDASFSMLGPIPVYKGQHIVFTAAGYNTVVGMIVLCNSDNTSRQTVVSSTSSNVETYEYDVLEDGYAVFSYKESEGYKLDAYIDYYDSLNNLYETFADVLSDDFNIALNLRPSETIGYFVNASNNNMATSTGFALLGPVPIYKGQHIEFTAAGYNTVVGMIVLCNSDNTSRQTVVSSTSSNVETYEYDVLEDGYAVFSYHISSNYILNLNVNYAKQAALLDLLVPEYAGTENVAIAKLADAFIDASNNHYATSNNFGITTSIRLLKNQTINLTATGYLTYVGMINLYDADADMYEAVAISIDSTERTYSYTATTDCYVRCCYLRSAPVSAEIVTTRDDFGRIVNIEDSISNIENTIAYPLYYDDVLCIGDSLTVGASGNGNEILDKNYPHFFGKLALSNTHIEGHGGYSAKEVWDSYISLMTTLSDYDCAIIYLGTNGGLTDTVDTDCDLSDYTQNTDNNTGCYGKIIGKIQADAPDCKIFVVAGPREYVDRTTTMNDTVRSLAAAYGVGLIDLEDCILSDDGSVNSIQRRLYRPVDGIHYNVLGYLTFANEIYIYMRNWMKDHLEDFT